MTVFVDQINMNKKRSDGNKCNLVADSVEELHFFAMSMGISRKKFQAFLIPHYKLSPRQRKQAIRLGAKDVGWRKMKKLVKFFVDLQETEEKRKAILGFLEMIARVRPDVEALRKDIKKYTFEKRSAEVIAACRKLDERTNKFNVNTTPITF